MFSSGAPRIAVAPKHGLRLFEDVGKARRGSRVVTLGAFTLASAVLHVLLALVVARFHTAAVVQRVEPVVEVQLIRPFPRAPMNGASPARRAPILHRAKVASQTPAAPPLIQPNPNPPALPAGPVSQPAMAPAPADMVAIAETKARGAMDGIVGANPGPEGGAAALAIASPRVDFDETMTAPKFLEGPGIEYSPEALRQQIEGLMVVRCAVTAEGRVYGCRVLQGLPLMDEEVVSVLQARHYSPALRSGIPIEVNYTFRVRLRLPR